MMTTMDSEKVETLEEMLQKMEEITESLRQLDDDEIRYRCLAEFEGREGGWLGEFARDILQRKLDAYLHGHEQEDEA